MLDRQIAIEEHRLSRPIEELERKAAIARRRGWFTQEDIDLATAQARIWIKELRWD